MHHSKAETWIKRRTQQEPEEHVVEKDVHQNFKVTEGQGHHENLKAANLKCVFWALFAVEPFNLF